MQGRDLTKKVMILIPQAQARAQALRRVPHEKYRLDLEGIIADTAADTVARTPSQVPRDDIAHSTGKSRTLAHVTAVATVTSTAKNQTTTRLEPQARRRHLRLPL